MGGARRPMLFTERLLSDFYPLTPISHQGFHASAHTILLFHLMYMLKSVPITPQFITSTCGHVSTVWNNPPFSSDGLQLLGTSNNTGLNILLHCLFRDAGGNFAGI